MDGTELASSSCPGELELKQSLCSPVHSKRSLSADTLRKLLPAQVDDEGERVVSAGNTRKGHPGDSESRRKRKGLNDDRGRSKRVNESHKSSVDLPFWESEVLPLLQKIDSTPYQEVGGLCESCSLLWACLEGRGLIGRTGGVGGSKKRNAVLRTVFKLIDHKDPSLLLKVAKIIIAVRFH